MSLDNISLVQSNTPARPNMIAAANGGRERSLDSLRGIAAILVLLSHATIAGLYKVDPIWDEIKWTPLRILWSGHQAVVLFFVLSGFALTRMWGRIGFPRYDAYLASRIARLYPPYLASLILAVCTYHLLKALGAHWDLGWMNVPNPVFGENLNIPGNLLMIGVFNPSEINPPIWSIIHEMRISIIFPLIYFSVWRLRKATFLVFPIISLLIAYAISGIIPLTPLQAELLISLHYSTFFAAGSFLAFHQDAISKAFSALKGRWRILTWAVALLLYAYPFDNPWTLSQRMIGDLAIGVGCVLIVALVLGSNEGRLLARFKFFGEISYSLYLNHYLVLSVALILLYASFGSLTVWVVTVPTAIILAWIMNILVEKPSIAASRLVRNAIISRKSDD
ncbi:acyltransferase [Rhizobium sp. P38BS-XIX]|uniref:acyltransferase family protein n=1 Tax=Rhizobium sp. P38BS-XIX TaxID=2726740 RepID=UPI001456D22C|nr:acyltransferase [Rhizobium sp. P38BS-XIX]NLR96433.1 acyltransferase [Rhizobium sp. P38BS-XIX]